LLPLSVLVFTIDVSAFVRKNIVGSVLSNTRLLAIPGGWPLRQTILVCRAIVDVGFLRRPGTLIDLVPGIDIDVVDVDVSIDIHPGVPGPDVRPGIRAIAAGSPPAMVGRTSPPAETKGNPKRPVRERNSETPAIPRVVSNVESPRPGTGIVMGAIPRRIMPSGPVNNTSMRVIAPHVTRGIANVNDRWSYIIDVDVGHVVVGA